LGWPSVVSRAVHHALDLFGRDGAESHYPNFLEHLPKPKIASRFSSTPHLK